MAQDSISYMNNEVHATMASMRLRHLSLEQFRNYGQFEFEFPSSDILILEGKNGRGKSNFLEAIYLLALTKSFRTRKSENMIQWGKDFFRVRAEIQTSENATSGGQNDRSKAENSEILLEQCFVQNPKKQKAFKKNNVIILREKFIGSLRTVLFRPEDLNMFTEEPALRRQYLNNIFIQTDASGLETLQNYQTILKQRNALILEMKNQNHKMPANRQLIEQLNVWNERLVQEGEKIQHARKKFITFLQSCLPPEYSVSYSASKPLKTALEKNLENDLRFGCTTVGPHREDLKIFFNSDEHAGSEAVRNFQKFQVSETASRGQLRRLILSFKKAERDWIQLQTGENPILLLDDIFSELDYEGKEEILKLLPASQVIMTIAEGNTLPKLKGEATVRKLFS